jgi:hypothetical protein
MTRKPRHRDSHTPIQSSSSSSFVVGFFPMGDKESTRPFLAIHTSPIIAIPSIDR